MQVAPEGMLWYHWLGGIAGSGATIAFFWWLVKRRISKTDTLESEHEKRQNARILKCEQRLDSIDARLQEVDRLEGRLMTRDKADELISAAKSERDKLIADEKELRETRDNQQDKRLDKIEKRLNGRSL